MAQNIPKAIKPVNITIVLSVSILKVSYKVLSVSNSAASRAS